MCITDILASFSSILAAYAHAHKLIVNITKVSIERNTKHVELTGFLKNCGFIDIGNFEVGIYFRDYRVCEIGVIAIRTSRHFSVLGAPDISGHDHIDTCRFVAYSIHYIVTSRHAQFGT